MAETKPINIEEMSFDLDESIKVIIEKNNENSTSTECSEVFLDKRYDEIKYLEMRRGLLRDVTDLSKDFIRSELSKRLDREYFVSNTLDVKSLQSEVQFLREEVKQKNILIKYLIDSSTTKSPDRNEQNVSTNDAQINLDISQINGRDNESFPGE